MKDNESKNSERTNLILDKLVIAIIVAGVTTYFHLKSSKELEKFKSDTQTYQDSLAGEQEKKLSQLKFNYDSILQKDQQHYSFEFKELSEKLDFQKQLDLASNDLKSQLAAIQINYENQLNLLTENVKADLDRSKNERKLQFVSTQLSEFYWPIYYRLEKNNSLYNLMSNTFVGERIDTAVILVNHMEVANIIENNLYLAQPDNELMKEINKYIRHANIYLALREGKYKGFPDDYDNDYPKEFFNVIKERTFKLQNRYNHLLSLDTLIEASSANFLEFKRLSSDTSLYRLDVKDIVMTLKLSWNNRSYFLPIDEHIKIVFKDYIPDGSFCTFKIDKIENTNSHVSNPNVEYVHMREGEIKWVEYQDYNYQFRLEDVFSVKEKVNTIFKKDRTIAMLRVKKWKMPTKNTSEGNTVSIN